MRELNKKGYWTVLCLDVIVPTSSCVNALEGCEPLEAELHWKKWVTGGRP